MVCSMGNEEAQISEYAYRNWLSKNCERCDCYIPLHQYTNYPSIKRLFNKLKKLLCIDCIDGGYVDELLLVETEEFIQYG